MRSQLQIELRGKDPTTLEVVVPDAISATLGQYSPATLADMMALAELEQAPKRLVKDLQNFARRIENEIADLPSGPGIIAFADGLAELPAARVPLRLRAAVAREAERPEKRTPADRARLRAALEGWGEQPPEPFPLGGGRGPRVIRTTETREPPPKADERRRGPREAAERAPRGERPSPSPRPTRTVAVADPERVKWIERQVTERLEPYGDKGLKEVVLLAGVRHAARATYPDLQQPEITAAMQHLKAVGRIRYSAGRWSLPGRW